MEFREIGVGEGDVEMVRDLAAKIRRGRRGLELVPSDPPAAQAVYVCGWCVRVVDREEMNWRVPDGVCVCDGCADDFFTIQPGGQC